MADGTPGFHRWFINKLFAENGHQPLTEKAILADTRLDPREQDLIRNEIAAMATEGLICRVGDVLIYRSLGRAKTGTPAGRPTVIHPRTRR